MRLLHYSATTVTEVRSTPDQNDALRMSPFKPIGFWISVEGDDDWAHWCQENDFGVNRLQVIHEVKLSPGAKVLHIETAEELDEFFAEYRCERGRQFEAIRWGDVACKFQGIIISPYLYERRFGPLWYYGWDCASGCIWDATAISSIEVVA